MTLQVCTCVALLLCAAASHAARTDFYGPQTFNNNHDDGVRQQESIQQYREPEVARAAPSAILTHKQERTNDGVFNYVFAADNGLKQGESISPDGTRTGAYQYVDPNGKTITVKYTAGKDGFKILEGDHVPRQPKPVEPIPEFQPPEYRERLLQERQNAAQGDQAQGRKYKTSSQEYKQPQYQPQSKQYHQEEPQQQRYTKPSHLTYKPLMELFSPEAQQAAPRPTSVQQQQGGQGGRGAQVPRASLYNVQQRHNANYRRYQDNGKPVGGGDDGQEGPSVDPNVNFNGGYNFEFKG